jgi:ATP-binding cassette subfamily B multidrug efflux pump
MKNKSEQKPQLGTRRGHGRGPMLAMPVEKPKDFRGTLTRLLRYLKPFHMQLIIVLLASLLSTAFNIFSPKIIGLATTKIFTGITARMEGAVGAGIDFNYILRILFVLAVLYIASAVFSYIHQIIMAIIAQKTVFNMRNDVINKLSKLPLKFFDTHTHGEILSRVTNDIDNISHTLQQSITQIFTSVITLSGIIIIMLTISPFMTMILIVTLPLYAFITKFIAKHSQKHFSDQQKILGELNGYIEEVYTGHAIIKAFSREEQSIAYFAQINAKLYTASWKAQFISGVIMPLMSFVNNIGYIFIAVVGGILVTRKAIPLEMCKPFCNTRGSLPIPLSKQPILPTSSNPPWLLRSVFLNS